MDPRIGLQSYNENIGSDYDRQNHAYEDNVQATGGSTCRGSPCMGSLAGGTDVEKTLDQTTQEETKTQGKVKTSYRTVKLVDSKSSPDSPIESKTICLNMEASEGLQDTFIKCILSEQTANPTLTQRFSQLPEEVLLADGELVLPNHQISTEGPEQIFPSQPERPIQYIQDGILYRSRSSDRVHQEG